VSRLEEISARLDELTRELEGGEIDDERAAALTREAAELANEALGELERRLQELAPDE
jgi:exonuclease VII small subunit